MYDNGSRNILLNIIILLIEFKFTTILIYLVAVSLGAYIIDDFWETLIFSSFMSLVGIMPLLTFVKHKNPLKLLEKLLVHQEYNSKLEKKLVRISYGSTIGAWFGALVIPLDWDRWWQKWPISCIIGAILGIFFALVTDLSILKNKAKQDS